MLFQTSLGIDIQDKAISIAYLKGSFRGPSLKAHAIYPLEAVGSTEEKMDLIGGLVKEFLRENRISPVTVFFGVSRNVAVLRYVQLPLSVKENLRESLGYQIDKYVPFSVDEVYYDCQVIEEDKGAGNIRILLVAAKKGAIAPYLSLADKLNLRLSGIEVSATAMANCVLSQSDLKGSDPCALIYMSEDLLEFGRVRSGVLDYSRRVEVEDLTSNSADLIIRELEKVKIGLNEGDAPLEVLVFGSKTSLQQLDALEGFEGFSIRTHEFPDKGLSSPELIPACGLALKGIMKLPMETNLVPQRFRKRPNKTGLYVMFGLAGLLVLSLMAWGGGRLFHQQLYVQRLNEEIRQLQAKAEKTEKVRYKVKQVEDRINFLNGFYKDDVSVLEALKELTVRIPKNAWVHHLRFSDGEIRIDGLADSSSELVSLLDQSPIFKNVAFVSTISRDKTGKERFRIKLEIE